MMNLATNLRRYADRFKHHTEALVPGAVLNAAADRIEELEVAMRSIVDDTEATPENMPDLDGYTVREAWEHGWHRGQQEWRCRLHREDAA